MGSIYPEVKDRKEHIVNVVKAEEERFYETLAAGTERLMEKNREPSERPKIPLSFRARKLSCFMTHLDFPWISLRKY